MDVNVKHDSRHHILAYDFKSWETQTVLNDYVRCVRSIRLRLLGLPTSTRNWEQVEAHAADAELSESITLQTTPPVLLRIVLNSKKGTRIVDLVKR